MKTLPKHPALVSQLQALPVFADIPPEALQWLVDTSEYRCYEEGEKIFSPGEPVSEMEILLDGQCSIRVATTHGMQEIALWEAGAVIGLLPFSRMKEARANGIALKPCYVLALHRDHFTEMVNRSYRMTQALVARMSDRVRDFTSNSVQQEKLAALGKLSAGLAHELNNPAAAMVRNAGELYRKVHATPERFKAIMTMGITPEQTDRVNQILFSRIENAGSLNLSLMEREEKLDELLDWLEEQEVEEPDDIAETFVDYGMSTGELNLIAGTVGQHALPAVLWWLESTLSLERLVEEIQEASNRISTLVSSVKEYSHMDRSTAFEPVALSKGLRTTLRMLKHKLREKGVAVHTDWPESLPKVNGYAGELNQVWTNLISNAVDALPEEGGQLRITAQSDRDSVFVSVEDNGSGIPEDIQGRIFEPFFTTKPMDQGTGMGLDIVKKIVERHQGSISVESEPGRTVFRLRFPALPPANS